ncbi:MAG: hypothetical protein HKL99_12705 [Burkholderiales bacterium]|jgi:hypothetical protein|nr:hypothetical protein [Burkholderiales bacterium]
MAGTRDESLHVESLMELLHADSSLDETQRGHLREVLFSWRLARCARHGAYRDDSHPFNAASEGKGRKMIDGDLAIKPPPGMTVRTVGRRIERRISSQPDGQGVAAAAALTESLVAMGGGRLVRKGVYRFMSHEDADRQQQHALAESMADLVQMRRHG